MYLADVFIKTAEQLLRYFIYKFLRFFYVYVKITPNDCYSETLL